MAAWGGNGYLYIVLYVFIFLTLIFSAQLLSEKSEAYIAERDNKHKYKKKNTTTITTNTSSTPGFFFPNTTTSIHETDNIDEIVSKTKGRSKGEKICRYYLEDIYKKPFPSTYPKFLRNPQTKGTLELDGYNEELGIAFEYNGRQHYEHVPYFQRNNGRDFLTQIERDKFKKKKCKENNVYLITIPYKVPHEEIKDCIDFYLPENVDHRRKLQKMGYDVPEEYVIAKNRS